jgi:hypothetical protein
VQEGGGWCISEEDCLARSATALGSSSQWPPSGCPSMDGGSNGMLSDSQAINPYFYNWNGVHVNVSLYIASQWVASPRPQPVRRPPARRTCARLPSLPRHATRPPCACRLTP